MKFVTIIAILTFSTIKQSSSARLHKIFQYIDGYQSDHNTLGFLHIGVDYAVFLRVPKPHDKYLIYELYAAKNIPDVGKYKPRLIAVSQVPVAYIKEQLKIYRTELYTAKYVDDNVVPGTRVKTLREWQIQRALTVRGGNGVLKQEMPVLRSIL